MSIYADWFIGGISILLGVAAIFCSVTADERMYVLPKVRLLAETLGRAAARWFIGGLGALLLVGGILIALGYSIT